jgi:hypothetical protein
MAKTAEPKLESSRPLTWDTAMQAAIKRLGLVPAPIVLSSKVEKKFVESEKSKR